MAIQSMDDLVLGLANSQDQQLFFPSVTQAAGGWIWMNRATTSSFGIIADPAVASSGGTTFNQTAGTPGYPRWTAGSGNAYIGRVGVALDKVGTMHIYDMHWACSGFNGTLLTSQDITGFSGMPSRNPTALGAELWMWVLTPIGATAKTVTVTYTNQDGVGSRTSIPVTTIVSMPAYRMLQIPLQSGDTGITSIESVKLSGSTGTAGNFGLIVMNRICSVAQVVANVGNSLDFATLGLPKISDDSCISFVNQGSTTTTGITMGQMSIIHG